jgi:hypothetical protein
MVFPGFGTVAPRSPFTMSRPDCLTISIQGVEMLGEGDGLYTLTGWDGWGGGGTTRGGFEEYEDVDGGFPTEVTYSGRDITLEGMIHGDSHREFAAARERLEKVLTRPREDWLRVDEDHLGVVRQILVHRPRPVQVSPLSDRYGIFTLSLRSATYPRLAATESTLVLSPGESGRQENLGDYPADLSVFLRGPLTNPRITWSSQFWWQFTGTIPDGETRIVDMTRRIIRDPTRGTRLDLSGSGTWPRVDPGYRTVAITGSGSGTVEMVWRSAWA